MKEGKKRLVCIGDSVASPFKLRVRTNTLSQLLARRLGFDYDDPFILAGGTSRDLLRNLNENDEIIEAVTNSDLIVLVIGSNNITMTYLGVMASSVGIPFNGRMINRMTEALKSNPVKAATMIKTMNSSETRKLIQQGVDDFCKEMPQAIERIKELSPDICIILQNIYSMADTTINPVYKVMSRGQAQYIDQLNKWMTENADTYGFLVSDLRQALSDNKGIDYTNVRSNDIHLNDQGHILAYRTLYDTLISEYPEMACEEGVDVINVRKRTDKRESDVKGAENRTEDELIAIVKDATCEFLGCDESSVVMDQPFSTLGMTELDTLEVAKILEKWLWNDERQFFIPNGDFGAMLTPMYFVDVIQDRFPETVKEHPGLLDHYETEAEKAASCESDSEGMRIVRNAIYDYIEDDNIKVTPDMTFLGDLLFNFNDLAETTRFMEIGSGIRMEATRREHPETIKVSEAADFIDANA